MQANTSLPVQRWTRKTLEESDAHLKELAEKSQKCKIMELSSISAGMAADLAGDEATAASSIPLLGAPFAYGGAAVAAASHAVKGGLDLARVAMDCSSVPFEEIKEIMDRRFNEVNRKLDENAAALAKISDVVGKTLSAVESVRYQMAEGFKNVLNSIKESRVEPVITQINNFAKFFEGEKKRLGHLKKREFIFSLEQPNYLNYLKDSRTPKGDSLQTSIFAIIDQGFALPQHSEDEIALHALFALYYGTQTFVEVMYFLIDKYRYLADYYYEKGNLTKFNNYFLLLKLTIHDFKYSFVGFTKNEGILNTVIRLLQIANEKDLDGKKETEIKEQIDTLIKTKLNLYELNAPFIKDPPENLIGITLNDTKKATKGGNKCENNLEIMYAIQYEKSGLYSPISDWLDPVLVRKNRKTVLDLPSDRHAYNRLIFRQFDNQISQLVKVVNNVEVTFVDIDRDLYDAVKGYDQKFAMREMAILLSNGANINAIFEKRRTVMHAAAQRGHCDLAKNFFNDMDFNVKDIDGNTPLHLAVESRQTKFVQLLVKNGVEINAKTVSKNSTPLHIASEKGYFEIIKILLTAPDIETNVQDKFGFTPLHYAVKNGRRIVEILINKPETNINTRSDTGITPFHTAVMVQDSLVVDALLARSRERGNTRELINTKDEKSNTALHFAILYYNNQAKNLSIFRSLLAETDLEANIISDQSKSSPLHLALILKQSDTAELLIRDGKVDLNLKMERNVTPLHLAISTGMTNAAIQLINNGSVQRDEPNDEGYTPLHLAAIRPETEVVKTLLQVGVKDIDAETSISMTPLHVAADNGRLGAVQMLIDWGARTDIKTNEGETFFYFAVRNGNLDLIKYCVSKIDINSIQENWQFKESIGYFAACEAIKHGKLDVYLYFESIIRGDVCNSVYMAAFHGQLDLLRYFIETQRKSVKASIRHPYSEPPIFAAVKNDHLRVVKYFIEEQKEDINTLHKGEYLIHYALTYTRGNILQYLVTKGINLKALDNENNTLLHRAIPKRYKMFKFLLEQNSIDINAVNKHKGTALHKAADYSNEDMKSLELLCKYKPDVTKKNNEGQTASDIMKRMNKTPAFCLAANNRYRKNIEEKTQNAEGFSTSSKFKREKPFLGNDEASKWGNILFDSPKSSLAKAKSLLMKPEAKAYEGKHLYESHVNRSLDLMGFMLLLDIFLKKMNGQTYKLVGDAKTSINEARSFALNVTNRFEKFLSSSSKLVPSEHIDISKVYSNILRAFISSKFNKLPGILRSYTELFPDINPAAFETFLKNNAFDSLEDLVNENI